MRCARFCLSLLVALALAGVASAAPRNPRLRSVHTWAFAIGDGDLIGNLVSRYAGYDLLVLDGQEATARQVHALRHAGKIVLAYLDVGTIEKGRPWYHAASRYRLDYWPDWGEWYADVAAPGFRKLISGTVAPSMLAQGLRRIVPRQHRHDRDPPAPDVRDADPGPEAGAARARAGQAPVRSERGGHDRPAPALLRRLEPRGRERHLRLRSLTVMCASPTARSRRLTGALRRIARAGLLTLATDYTAAGDAATAGAAVRNACSAGALPFVSDIDLTRVPAVPARC